MDFFDQASAREEFDTELARAIRKPTGPLPTGLCLNCGNPVLGHRRWCDSDCRDDWQSFSNKVQK